MSASTLATLAFRLSSLLVVLTTAFSAAAREVQVPIQFDHAFIRQALVAQIFTAPGEKALLWDDGTGCGFLKLREPAVNSAGGRLRVVTRSEGRVGKPLAGQCLAPIQWDGYLELFEEPRIGPDQQTLQFRIVESNIYDQEWKKGLLTGKLWDLVKEHVQPKFEAVRIDLKPALDDLHDLLPLVVSSSDQTRIETMLASLHLANALTTETGVALDMGFTVSDIGPVAAPTPEPTLTPEELQRWEQAWQRWDAFLTFVVKQFGTETGDQELRQAFFDVLMEGRYDIIEALAPSAPGTPDPTRALFIKTWTRLVPVVRRTASTLPGTTALRYLSFIAAGDALAALDQVGSEVGLDISADGLRRLARMAAPLSSEDPLEYSTAVDPGLRQLFGFGARLPPPDLSAEPSAADVRTWWRHILAARPAFAATEQAPPPKALEQWVPPTGEALDAYLQAVRDVLNEVTRKTLQTGDLAPPHQELYRHLVRATAWQESCWRQFVRDGNKVTYMKSAVGSTGIMQINEHVWRGFYEIRGLRWDIRYNATAGSEVVLRYLKNYALTRQPPSGVPDFYARVTYAVYNGGPGAMRNFFKKEAAKVLNRIDGLFWQKFKAISSGSEDGVAKCLVGG